MELTFSLNLLIPLKVLTAVLRVQRKNKPSIKLLLGRAIAFTTIFFNYMLGKKF
jgi:hypothetical protein